jgi:hypothetical protein
MTTVPLLDASFERGTCATEGLELVNVTIGIGDFGMEINVAVADVFDPAVSPYDATEKFESSANAATPRTATAERLI